MRTVEQIVEQIRSNAGADFAFVLTRKGRLVTPRAPRDMPEEGRDRLVRAARPLIGTDRVIELTLPREDLVPYGGAAPVDVYIGTAAEQAIVCVVMASWADKRKVAAALQAGLDDIEPLLRRGLPVAAGRARDVGPAKGSPFRASQISSPALGDTPGSDRPPSFPDLSAPPESFIAARSRVLADQPAVGTLRARIVPSAPEIHIGEAELGRNSMAAIRHELDPIGSIPEITFGETELGRGSMVAIGHELIGTASAPEIIVTGEASIGRETMVAIDADGKPRPTSSPDSIRVDLVSMPDLSGIFEPSRATVPWVEAPEDSKRAVDAAAVARGLAPPKVALKLEDAADDVLAAARAELSRPAGARAPQATRPYDGAPPKPLPPKAAKR